MSTLSKAPFATFLLVLSILIFGIATLGTFDSQLAQGSAYPEYSTYRSDPKGLKALYESLRQIPSLQVDRVVENLSRLESGRGEILCLAGLDLRASSLEKPAYQALEHWVQSGGKLIVTLIPEAAPQPGPAKPETAPRTNERMEAPISWNSILHRWGVTCYPLRYYGAKGAESPIFGPVRHWAGNTYFDSAAQTWRTTANSVGKPVLIERSEGAGTIIVMADTYVLSNESLASDPPTSLLLWLFGDRPMVRFDETHLGIQEKPGIMSLARRYGLQGTLVSLVMVALVFVWASQYRLLPRSQQSTDLEIAGASSANAFVNLLRRNLETKELLATCVEQLHLNAVQSQQVTAILDSGSESLVDKYNQVFRFLKSNRYE